MEGAEVLRRANEIAQPHGLRAEFSGDPVGVEGDERACLPALRLVPIRRFQGWDVVEMVAKRLTSELPVSSATMEHITLVLQLRV